MKFRLKHGRQAKTVAVGSALSLFLSEYGLQDHVILAKLQSGWQKIVGELLAVHSMPDRIFRNILFIRADHPIYSNELSFMKRIILSKLNEEYGSAVIKDVRVEIKNLEWHPSREV